MSRTRTIVLWVVVVVLVAGLIAAFPLITAADRAPDGSWMRTNTVHYGARIALIVVSLVTWFITQRLIGARAPLADGSIGDLLHDLTAPANRWLHQHPRAANGVLIASSLIIDCFAVGLIGASIFGPTLRPFLALFLALLFRQVCQTCCALPAPQGMIWRHPGFPSLMVTYAVANDFFISGHTAIAVLAGIEAAYQLPLWAAAIVGVLAAGEAITVIVLRAHYTMDVLAALTAAWCAAEFANRLCAAM